MKSPEDNIHALFAKQNVNSECGRAFEGLPTIQILDVYEVIILVVVMAL